MTLQEYSTDSISWPEIYSDGLSLPSSKTPLFKLIPEDEEINSEAFNNTSALSIEIERGEEFVNAIARMFCILLIEMIPSKGVAETLETLTELYEFYTDPLGDRVTQPNFVKGTGKIVSTSTRSESVITE